MSHEKPLPDDATTLDPLKADPLKHATRSKKAGSNGTSTGIEGTPETKISGRTLGLAAGAAIGSAAVTAALLFYNRPAAPAKRAAPKAAAKVARATKPVGKAAAKPKPATAVRKPRGATAKPAAKSRTHAKPKPTTD